ncbi:uncharacterized protein LOC131803678 [Musca domestica]|uniref:Uncharacterized protein LOC101888985 n=1 Tax=Musca domestica TaxID=7370 RepID=A0A1I8MEM6_MUSDO|nr:uncharacterized protein LOC101888985 [Musca domestica]XP_058981150.1 uncharacterized protein LOC131803678 [Musca domestica]
MYGKVLLCLAFVAVIALPLANSLKCYECRDVNSCKNPTTVQCNQINANATRDALLNTYHNVQITNTTRYACYVGIYSAGKATVFDVRGCIPDDAVSCSAPLVNSTWVKQTCDVCTKDSCNKKNSVGTFSSSIFTMIGLLFVAKVFVN